MNAAIPVAHMSFETATPAVGNSYIHVAIPRHRPAAPEVCATNQYNFVASAVIEGRLERTLTLFHLSTKLVVLRTMINSYYCYYYY